MKILIVGFGSIAKKHLKAIFKVDKSAQVFALRSSTNSQNEPRVKDIFQEQDIPNDLDFVIISNPTSEHFNTIKNFMKWGVPLFIEKPVLSSIENSDFLENELKKSGCITYVACNLRFHPAISYLKDELDKRTPLEFNAYAGSYLPDWRPDRDYTKVYSAIKSQGGGVHLDLIHEIDLTFFLLGEPVNVISYLNKKSELEIDSIDIAHYVLEYKDISAFITLNYYRKIPKREIEVVWREDVWNIDLIENKIKSVHHGVIFHEPYHVTDTYEYQMKYFLDCIENNKKPMNDFSESLKVLSICLTDS